MKINHIMQEKLSDVVKTFGMNVIRIQGVFDGSGADHYLQLYDAKVLPANGDNASIKKYEEVVQAGARVFTEFTDLKFSNGCVLAISTTSGDLTIATGTDTFTGLLEGESAINDTGWTVAGDYTSADADLQVWADAAGPKNLVRLEFTTLTDAGADRYACIRASNSGAGFYDVAVAKSVLLLPRQTSVQFFFGDGLSPFDNRSGGGPADGCSVGIGTYDSSTLIFTEDASPNYAIRATYKA